MGETKETNRNRLTDQDSRNDSGITRRELLERLSPMGRAELDASKCTACGLCAIECPTGALSIVPGEETDTFRLLFKQAYCIACNQCAALCPEKCLSIERVLEAEKVDSEVVLFEDTIVRCSQCGKPIGPRSMVTKVEARVVGAGYAGPDRFGLCPACKIQARLGQLRL